MIIMIMIIMIMIIIIIITMTMTTTTTTTTTKPTTIIKREVLERQLAPNQLRVNQEEQSDRPNSEDEDSHNNTPPGARSYEAEGNVEYLDKIKEWMRLGSERPRIPLLKTYSQKNSKEKTKKVNDIATEINPHKYHHRNQHPSICRSKTGSRTNGNKNTPK